MSIQGFSVFAHTAKVLGISTLNASQIGQYERLAVEYCNLTWSEVRISSVIPKPIYVEKGITRHNTYKLYKCM